MILDILFKDTLSAHLISLPRDIHTFVFHSFSYQITIATSITSIKPYRGRTKGNGGWEMDHT